MEVSVPSHELPFTPTATTEVIRGTIGHCKTDSIQLSEDQTPGAHGK